MNTAIVLLVVCAAAVEVLAGPHGNHGEKMKKNFEECLASTGADPELVKAVKHGEATPDQNVKCFSACFAKKMGTMNEDGTINKQKLDQMAMHAPEEHREAARQALGKCSEISGDDECDTGYRFFECMRPLMKSRHRKQN